MYRSGLEFAFLKIKWNLRCDQNNAAHSDNLPLALVFEDVPLARFLQSDGAQVGSTFQRCYCVTKRLSASVVRPITLPSYACNRQSQQHISLSKRILLWPNKTCINSEQALPPLHVWNHCFVFTLEWAILDLHCQVSLNKKFPLCEKTSCVSAHQNILKGTNVPQAKLRFLHVLPLTANASQQGLTQTANKCYWRNFPCIFMSFL